MKKKNKNALWIISIVLMAIVGAALVKYGSDGGHNKRIADLELMLNEMRSAIHVDSMRQYHINKIIAIIDQYNVEMQRHRKYEIAEEVYKMSQKYSNLNVDLICATITHESAGTWDPEVISPAGAMGLMQIMPATGMFIASYEGVNWSSAEEVLYDPIYNIRIGSRYLSSLIELYNVDGGLAAYNGGEHRAALWIGSGKAHGILARETQQYIPAIQRLYEEFQDFRL